MYMNTEEEKGSSGPLGSSCSVKDRSGATCPQILSEQKLTLLGLMITIPFLMGQDIVLRMGIVPDLWEVHFEHWNKAQFLFTKNSKRDILFHFQLFMLVIQ